MSLSVCTRALPLAKGIRSVAPRAKLSSDQCGTSQISYTAGYWACLHKHSGVNSYLWAAEREGNSCWDPQSRSPSDIPGRPCTHPTWLEPTQMVVVHVSKSQTLVQQPARSIASPDTEKIGSLCKHGGCHLQPCWNGLLAASLLTSHAAGRGVRRSYLWDEAFFSDGFWSGLFICLYGTADKLRRNFIYFSIWCTGLGYKFTSEEKKNAKKLCGKVLKILHRPQNRPIPGVAESRKEFSQMLIGERYVHHAPGYDALAQEPGPQGSARATWSMRGLSTLPAWFK